MVDPRHLKEARRRIIDKREEHHAAQRAYLAQCREKVPGLEGLDSAIQRTVTQAIAAALRQGTDPAPAVEAARKENLSLQAKRLELLGQAGIDPAALEETPFCPLCKDTGYADKKLCGCITKLCAEENLAELGAVLDLKQTDFANVSMKWYSTAFDPEYGMSSREAAETVLEVCRDYAKQFPGHPCGNLFLYGGTGLGKTFFSGCIAKAVAAKGFWTVYATAGELFGHYEAVKFGRDDGGESQRTVERYQRCDLLVLDDLGSEMLTPFVQSALYQLLNERMNRRVHTVISSNLTMDDVRARYSPQVCSRLEGEYHALPFFGKDIRLQKREKGLG